MIFLLKLNTYRHICLRINTCIYTNMGNLLSDEYPVCCNTSYKAIENNHLECLKIIIMNESNGYGCYIYEHAAEKGNMEI